jgi:hypothetical protein
MIRFLADEDFNNDILRSLLRRASRIDTARVAHRHGARSGLGPARRE